MINEFTVTFTAEVTAIFQDREEMLEYLCSKEFREDAREAILGSEAAHVDCALRDVKVFISKEDAE